jgi:predicted RNA-binding protein with PIN domain
MKVFVDGDDLLEVFREVDPQILVPGDEEKSRTNVARWLARYAEFQDCDVELVYEEIEPGKVLPPVEQHGRVRVRNLQPDEEVLHEIAGAANRAAERERVYVVTEDPRLSDAVSGGAARVYAPRRFIGRARTVMGTESKERYDEPDEKYTGVGEEEVDFWMEFFDED